MKFDFDRVFERRGTDSVKWDLSKDSEVLAMWVADMDFKTAPAIIEALERRAKSGIFGYALPPEKFYEALIGWFKKRHGADIAREWLLYTTGVVPALSAIIRALTSPGDKVLIQEPVYNCFFSSIRNNGCEIVSSDLKILNGRYEMDFEDLERKLGDPKVKLFILCSPHNPSGRIWTKDELQRAGELCLRHKATLVSDEIHCDLLLGGRRHIPFLSLGGDIAKNSVTCASPSKSFNLAGLHVANIIAQDAELRGKIDRALNINEVCEISPFAIDAQIAAYARGAEWLDELLAYLEQNFKFLRNFLRDNLPNLSAMELESTYLPWIDCRKLGLKSEEFSKLLLDKAKLWINPGTLYGKNGEGFVRINIACPRATLREGLERMKGALK